MLNLPSSTYILCVTLILVSLCACAGSLPESQPPCADPESFVKGVQLLQRFFQLMREERIQTPLQRGHHRSANETPFKWRSAGVPNLAKRGCCLGSFVIFRDPDQYY